MLSDKAIDLNVVKTFFNPGLEKRVYGRGIMPPTPAMPPLVQTVAEWLDGKTISLADAVAKIQSAIKGQGEVVVREACIFLYSIPLNSPNFLSHTVYIWRVIDYR